MLARQNANVKIIEIDQKTGLPLSECQELAADFKLTLKKDVDPAAMLAAKRARQQAAQPTPEVKEETP